MLFRSDLIKDISDLTLLINDSKLGMINSMLLSKHLLDSRKIDFLNIINPKSVEDINSYEKISKPFIDGLNFKSYILQDDLEEILKIISEH